MTTIVYSYTDAARRLLADANTCEKGGGSLETTSHLAGLSAECVLKSILVGLKLVTPGPDGQLRGKARVHINALWAEFQSLVSGHAGATYLSLLPTSVPPPFDQWLIDHRYAAAGQLDPQSLRAWLEAANLLADVLNEAVRRKEAQ